MTEPAQRYEVRNRNLIFTNDIEPIDGFRLVVLHSDYARLEQERDKLRDALTSASVTLAAIGCRCREATAEDSTADEIEMQEILCSIADTVNGMSYDFWTLSEVRAALAPAQEPEA